jgi:hypothetical protein
VNAQSVTVGLFPIQTDLNDRHSICNDRLHQDRYRSPGRARMGESLLNPADLYWTVSRGLAPDRKPYSATSIA